MKKGAVLKSSNKRSLFLAIVMAVTLIFSSSAKAVPNTGMSYTALGDSIAYGTGATDFYGYTAMLNDYLTETRGPNQNEKWNLAQNGLTSRGLLLSLDRDPDVREQVSSSDIITVSISGNDLLRPYTQALAFLVIQNYKDIPTLTRDLARWEENPGDLVQLANVRFQEMFLHLMAREFPDAVNGFADNWKEIIRTLRQLQPDAEIYVSTLLNPFPKDRQMHDLADPYIRIINAIIQTAGASVGLDYTVVDVYSRFESSRNKSALIPASLIDLAFPGVGSEEVRVPLHPTDRGYKVIFDLHKDAMK